MTSVTETPATDATPQAEATPSTDATPPTSSRKQLGDIIDVNISTARIRTTLSKYGINENIHKLISKFKDATSVDELTDDISTISNLLIPKADSPIIDMVNQNDISGLKTVSIEDVKTAIVKALGRHVLRIGDDAIVAFTSTINYVIVSLMEHGVKTLAADKKKTLKTHHIANDGLKDTDIWYLIRDLNCVKNALKMSEERTVSILKKKEARKIKNKLKNKNKKDKSSKPEVASEVVADVVVEKVEAETEVVETPKPGKNPMNGFRHHVFGIASKLVKESVSGDVSSDARTFGSHVVFELCRKYSKMIKVLTSYAKVKTIKAVTITSINDLLTIQEDTDYSTFNEYVSTRIGMYNNHSKTNV